MNGKHHEYLTIAAFLMAAIALVALWAYMNGSLSITSKGTKATPKSPASGSATTQGSAPPLAPSS